MRTFMPLPIVGVAGLLKALSQAKNPGVVQEGALPPLDLSPLQNLPRETEQSATNKRRVLQGASGRPTAFPPAVPFNYPNS